MSGEFDERRRSPRLEIAPRAALRLNRRVVIQLIDVSESGVLVSADSRLPVGTVGQMRLALGGQSFEASVQVRREQIGPDHKVMLGAAIVQTDPASKEVLDRFLARASES